MTFHLVTACPQDIDTFVCFMQYDDVPDFSDAALQEAFDVYFGGDDFGLSAGDVKSFRLKMKEKFVNLLLAAFDFSTANEFADFRKITLKLGSKLNEVKAENIFVDGLSFFSCKEEILRQFSSTLPLCDYAFDKYKQKKSDFADKKIFVLETDDCENYECVWDVVFCGEFVCSFLCA